LPPDERKSRVLQLSQSPKHVLVCTDCLSEGINLQEHFDAVLHYDLSWNPTRHEQREGRVDRYGQNKKPGVRVITYYGVDNQIDGVVLDVLIRKHKTIRSSLGISVPVPVDTEQVIEAIFEGLLLRSKPSAMDNYLPGFEEYMRPQKEDLYGKWDAVSEREKRSRTLFAQETIKVEEVAQELNAAQAAVGSGVDVAAFTQEALRGLGATVSGKDTLKVDLRETPRALRDVLSNTLSGDTFEARFEPPFEEGQMQLVRTHPLVESLSNYILETALDPLSVGPHIKAPARRCGAIRTAQVERRMTLLLIRFRYHIITTRGGEEKPLLAEDCQVLAFAGPPQNAEWLDGEAAEHLLRLIPDMNINSDLASDFVRKVEEGFESFRPHLDEVARLRGEELLEAHQRVRRASKVRNVQYRVEPQLPPDVLGIYVYLPKIG